MAYIAYANYTCYFDNQAQYEFARSFGFDGSGFHRIAICPVDAATLFGLTFPPPAGPLESQGFLFQYPYFPGTDIKHPGPSGVILDPAILQFTVPGQSTAGGVGQEMTLIWSCRVVFGGLSYIGADPLVFAPCPSRRWVMGWEGFNQMELHPQSGTGPRAREASRTVDGFGFKLRNESNAFVDCNLSNAIDYPGSLPVKNSWERFYINVRKYGVSAVEVWRVTGSVSTNSGARLILNTDGTMTGWNVDGTAINVQNLGTTPAFTLGTWYKVDVILRFATAILNGVLQVWINGVMIFSTSVGTGGVGLGQNQNHRNSTLGCVGSLNNAWEYDLDDWHDADIPNVAGTESLNSLDFIFGTHVRPGNIVSASVGTWVGVSPFILEQFLNPFASSINYTSSTALDTLTALTDVVDVPDYLDISPNGAVKGITALTVSAALTQNGGAANDGKLGYITTSGSALLTRTAGAQFQITTALLVQAGVIPVTLAPVSIQYQKGNTGASSTVLFSITAFPQYVGLFGYEDGFQGDDPGIAFNTLMHNCRYPELIWGNLGPPPDGPVCVASFGYAGNSTAQELLFDLPVHLLIIRNITTALPPLIVTSTMFGAQSGGAGADLAADVVRIFTNPIPGADFGKTIVRITGSSNRVNQTGQNYRYVAYMDPAMRFNINGEINHGGLATTFNNFLVDSDFDPQFAMLFTGPDATGTAFLKGPRHTLFEMSNYNGTLITNGIQFGAGQFASQVGASATQNATAYSVFRTNDLTGAVMIQITSYTGNGAGGTRNIPLTPLSGRFPVMAIVVRRGGGTAAVYRDPGHSGINSSTLITGGITTTGITGGGIDFITVGTGLNTNLAEYDVFVIAGTASGWETLNGLYCGPNGVPPNGPWEEPPVEPQGVGVIGEGGIIVGGTNQLTLLKDVSGIYTLTPDKHTDTMYDRQGAQTSVELEIPDPTFKTGYIGG